MADASDKPAIFRAGEAVLALLLASMTVLVFGNVVMRYAFNSGILISEEISRLLFVWLIFLGAVLAMRNHEHLGMDTVLRMMGPRGQRITLILSQLLMLVCCIVLLIGGWKQTLVNLDNESPISGLSVAWVYAPSILAALGIGFFVSTTLWRALTGRLADTDLIQVSESEERVHTEGSEKP